MAQRGDVIDLPLNPSTDGQLATRMMTVGAGPGRMKDASILLDFAATAVSPHTSQQDPTPAAGTSGSTNNVLQLYTEAVWQRLQVRESKNRDAISLRVGLFKNILPEGLAEAPPALLDVPTTADVAVLKLLVEKYTWGALQPSRAFVERGAGGKVPVEICEGRTLLEQGVQEGDTIWIDSGATDFIRNAVWAQGPLTALHLFKTESGAMPCQPATVETAPQHLPKQEHATGSADAAIKASASAGKSKRSDPSAAAAVAAVAPGMAAGVVPKKSHKKKIVLQPVEAAAGPSGSPPAGSGAVAAAARAKAGRSTSISAAAAATAVALPPSVGTAAAARAAVGKAVLRRSLAGRSVDDDIAAARGPGGVTGIAALAAAAGFVAGLGSTSSGRSDPAPLHDDGRRRLRSKAGAPASAPGSEWGTAGPSVKKSGRVDAAAAEPDGAGTGEDVAGESKRVAEQGEAGRKSSRRSGRPAGTAGPSYNEDVWDSGDEEGAADLLLDIAAGFKRKYKRENLWDTESTLRLLNGIKRFYLWSSPDVVHDPWVRIRLSCGDLPGEEKRSALKDRFVNICNAAKRNFVGCRDKSLLSPEVQALAMKIHQELMRAPSSPGGTGGRFRRTQDPGDLADKGK